jgi:hypothetical protein
MFDIQYGVSLQEFVKSLDPIKLFCLISALSCPQTLRQLCKSTTIHNKVADEFQKY